jgi:hypothetical protein
MRVKTKQEVKDFLNTKQYPKKQSYLEGDNNNKNLQIKKGKINYLTTLLKSMYIRGKLN